MAKRPNTTPVWLRWVVLAFILYAGWQSWERRNDPHGIAKEPNSAARPAELAASLPTGLTIGGDIAGTGESAACGQTATIEVTGSRADGTPLPSRPALPLPVGLPQADAPWAPAVPGMKPGGVREVTLPASILGKDAAKALHAAEDQKLRYKLELKALIPAPVPGHLPFLASDLVLGTGALAHCGDTVRVHLQLWNADGTPGVSTRAGNGAPIEMTLGAATQFYGLDRGVMAMRTGSKRSLVIPPAYLHAAKGHSPADPRLAGLQADRAAFAEVDLVEIVDKATKTP